MKKHKGGGGANWMDTYGDMVTLLLCFFVLLYSMSTINQEKWIQIVQSFNPNAVQDQTQTGGNTGQLADPTQSDAQEPTTQSQIDTSIEQLYLDLKQYVVQQNAADKISVTKGKGYVFVSFNDSVFFDGDSYVLRQDGKRVLDDVGVMIKKASSSIDELRVLGHTAQADPNTPNNITVDRFLASNRATVALVYLQERNILHPDKMVSMSYGQWHPIASNATSAERSKNRRVELVITGKNLSETLGDAVGQADQYYVP